VHEMLDGFRSELDTYVDDMAERAVQLGGVALGTTQTVGEKTTLEAYPTDIHTVKEHLLALVERFSKLANVIRTNVDEADEAGDTGSADIFTGVSRGLDKSLWFLEAHLGA
jgi:starvation-inducible DNA-binding protein